MSDHVENKRSPIIEIPFWYLKLSLVLCTSTFCEEWYAKFILFFWSKLHALLYTTMYVVENRDKLRLHKTESPKTLHNIMPVGLSHVEGLDPFLYHSSIYDY